MRLAKLDVIRGIAVLGVMLVHSYGVILGSESATASVTAVSTILASGRFGVELFFLLSGFLMAWLYENPIDTSYSRKKFLLLRFFRIYPLWAMFSCFWFLLFYVESGDLRIEALVLSLFFLLWLSPSHFDTFIGGAWSIQIEVLSYLVFMLFRGSSTKKLLTLAVTVNLLGILFSFYSLDSFGVGESLRRLSFQTGFNFFLLGWLSARYFDKIKHGQLSLRTLFLSEIPASILLVWIITFLFTPAIYGNPIEAVGFVGLALVIAWSLESGSMAERVLQWFGRHSYFLFFAHFLFLYLMDDLFQILKSQIDSGLVQLAFGVTTWIVMTLILSPFAWLSMKFFEGPLNKLARNSGKMPR